MLSHLMLTEKKRDYVKTAVIVWNGDYSYQIALVLWEEFLSVADE